MTVCVNQKQPPPPQPRQQQPQPHHVMAVTALQLFQWILMEIPELTH